MNHNGINYFKIEGNISNQRILIFLPGLGAFKENYIVHLNTFLTDYKYIYAIDLPSQGSKGEWTIGNMVENLKEFINFVDDSSIKNIHLAGHSAGALSILSFLCNYDVSVEKSLLNITNIADSKTTINEILKQSKFAETISESSKVDKVLLYAPPDSFHVVFPKNISKFLKKKSQRFNKVLFNTLVNRTMKVLSTFSKNIYFHFELDKSRNPQYFGLKLNNHVNFFNYIENYSSIFEIQSMLDEDNKFQIKEVLKNKNILIHYGANDWLLKPFFNRKLLLDQIFKFDSSIEIKKHRNLGHLLNNRMRLDINLNKQMITNKEVINESKNYINQ